MKTWKSQIRTLQKKHLSRYQLPLRKHLVKQIKNLTHLYLVYTRRSYIILKKVCMTFSWATDFKGFNYRSATESQLHSVCTSFENETYFRKNQYTLFFIQVYEYITQSK